MKKRYTKKQITEAISRWRKTLRESAEDDFKKYFPDGTVCFSNENKNGFEYETNINVLADMLNAIVGKSIYDDPKNTVGIAVDYSSEPFDRDTENVPLSSIDSVFDRDDFYELLYDRLADRTDLFSGDSFSRADAVNIINDQIDAVLEEISEMQFDWASEYKRQDDVYRENIWKRDRDEQMDECDGGCAAGGGMITTGDVLGDACDHEAKGYMAAGCFHFPKSVMPVQKRYEIPSKKKKGLKNPYVKGATVIGKLTEVQEIDTEFPESISEAETNYYTGPAAAHFNRIVGIQPDPKTDVLYFNPDLRLVWRIKPDGQLELFKAAPSNGVWTITVTRLTKDDCVEFQYKGGRYPDENTAIQAIYKAAEKHKAELAKQTGTTQKSVNEQRFSPRDLMNWEAHGRDPRYAPGRRPDINVYAVQNELKQKFHGQFMNIRLTDMGGTWKAEFSIPELDHEIIGQQRVKTVIPRIDDIIRLLRIRGVEVNSYHVAAVPTHILRESRKFSTKTVKTSGCGRIRNRRDIYG